MKENFCFRCQKGKKAGYQLNFVYCKSVNEINSSLIFVQLYEVEFCVEDRVINPKNQCGNFGFR